MNKLKNEDAIIIFTALAQDTRLAIYKIIVKNSINGINPTQIAHELKIPKNTLSFHLSLLSQAGLCTYIKNGKSLIYKPNCERIRDAMKFLHKDCIACYDKFTTPEET